MKTYFLILLTLLAGCAHQLTVESPENAHILQKAVSTPGVDLQISTDAHTYCSGQQMKLTLTINAGKSLQNVHLLLYGLKSRYEIYKLNQEDWLNLTPGTHTLSYDHKIPPCSPCAGISPGNYNITAELTMDEQKLATAQTTINIQD